jgi:glycosyltransferase involved in cell wall biosynthesis
MALLFVSHNISISQMKILALWEGMSGVEYHRLYIPLKRLQIDHVVEVSISQNFTRDGLPALKDYDLVIFNRYMGELHYEILETLARYGVPYIVDVDDYWVLPKGHPTYKWFRLNNVKQAIIDGMKYADGVTCTTEALAAKIRGINPHVSILPNALDLTDEQWLQPKQQRDVMTFGWVGGLTHADDIQIISDAINAMCDKWGDRVRFVLCGWMPNNWMWDSILYRFNGGSTTLRPQVVVSQAQAPNEYGNFYRLFDVALAPLAETTWNGCKSELKIVEAAAYGLPVIASNVSPYTNHADNKGVQLVENRTDAWFRVMDWHMTNDVKQYGIINQVYCQQHHNLETINAKRLEFYANRIQKTVRN